MRLKYGLIAISDGSSATVTEDKETIKLVVFKDGASKCASLSPDEARHIASRLRVAANRVDIGETL